MMAFHLANMCIWAESDVSRVPMPTRCMICTIGIQVRMEAGWRRKYCMHAARRTPACRYWHGFMRLIYPTRNPVALSQALQTFSLPPDPSAAGDSSAGAAGASMAEDPVIQHVSQIL